MLPYDDDVQIKSFGDITIALIVLCSIVFMGEYLMMQSDGLDTFKMLLNQWGLVPDKLWHHFDIAQPLTLLTSCFLHGGFAHLFGNMLYLYLFGRSVEDRMGHSNYLFFYLICGLIAAFAYAAFNQDSTIACVGASGAISGVMGAYIVFNPDANIKVWMGWWIGTIKVSALLVMAVFYIQNILLGIITTKLGAVTHVGYVAHIAGFLAGLMLARMLETCKPEPTLAPAEVSSWKRVR